MVFCVCPYLCTVFTVLVFAGTSIVGCPEVCRCFGSVVDCSTRNLSGVPSGIPAWTTYL